MEIPKCSGFPFVSCITSASSDVVVIGGGMVGVETAELIAAAGCNVTVLEMGSEICMELGSARKYCIAEAIAEKGISIVTNVKVTEILQNQVVGEKEGETVSYPCDWAVIAVGSKSCNASELEDACHQLGIELISVGDAKEARRALEATREAFDAALAI